jgi:hypothetical protein
MREETERKPSTRPTVTSVVAASELALCADGLLAACGSGSLDVTAPVQTASAATTGSDV